MLLDLPGLENRKCVVLYGRAGSGKTRIAKYTSNIFDCHWKNDTKGIYDEKISREEAHKQIIIMNEANIYTVFSKKRLANTKKLMEGEGIPVENKWGQPFTGFINAYTLLTCNNLPYPFVYPVGSNSGFTEEEYYNDKLAMEERTELV